MLLLPTSHQQNDVTLQPVFILGFWYSGSELFHQLLRQDPSFTTPIIDFKNPRDTFSYTPPSISLINLISQTHHSPKESKLKVAYGNLSEEAWQANLLRSLKANPCSQASNKVLWHDYTNILRIKSLTDLFPNAKFIHVHRHPNTLKKVIQDKLANICPNLCPEHIEEAYEQCYRQYEESIWNLTTECLAETSIERLATSPMQTLKEIYRQLELPFSPLTEDLFSMGIYKIRQELETESIMAKSPLEEICSDTLLSCLP